MISQKSIQIIIIEENRSNLLDEVTLEEYLQEKHLKCHRCK